MNNEPFSDSHDGDNTEEAIPETGAFEDEDAIPGEGYAPEFEDDLDTPGDASAGATAPDGDGDLSGMPDFEDGDLLDSLEREMLSSPENRGPDSRLDPIRIALGADADAGTDQLLSAAMSRIQLLESAMTVEAPAEGDPEAHNILRQVLVEVSDGLSSGKLTAREAAGRLSSAADADLRVLDLDDIEVDFDIGIPQAGTGILAGALTARSTSSLDGTSQDPVETALLDAISTRDRLMAHRISGSDEYQDLSKSYQEKLGNLRGALNDARPGRE